MLAGESVEQADGTSLFGYIVTGISKDTKEGKEIFEIMDKELVLRNWFVTEASREDFFSKSTGTGFAVIMMPPGIGKSAGVNDLHFIFIINNISRINVL